MIGALKPFLRRMRTASRPSTSGRPTSMITRSICPTLAVCTPLVPLSTAIGSNSCSASCSTSASRSSESSSTIRMRFVIPRPQDRHQPGTALREIEHPGVKEQAGLLRADEISCHGRHPIKLIVVTPRPDAWGRMSLLITPLRHSGSAMMMISSGLWSIGFRVEPRSAGWIVGYCQD